VRQLQPRPQRRSVADMTEKPHPPTAWQGEFIAVYPDGTQSHFDSSGHVLRAGDRLADNAPFVIDRWEVSDEPGPDGRHRVVGILREAD
jgi:hypothetical protein